MTMNEGWSPSGGGGFLRVLGVVYLIKAIRRRREQRRLRKADGNTGS